VNEVHDNTLEGIWTGLRTSCGSPRVNKVYLAQYVAFSSGPTTSRRHS